jgi:5-oxoprolinase (ATP-hydrolysing)
MLNKLSPGTLVMGPAMIIDNTQTIVIIPEAEARILTSHVVIDITTSKTQTAVADLGPDPVQLSVFGHRFMSIAEQMGRTLQKTAVSLNIKERLDFSCAIFGPDAGLVANAPHIPVHLGSMSYAVQYQHKLYKDQLKPGDVLCSNHPESGGTHLPDITVITPVFGEDKKVAFYVAARGHHTDIGGYGGTSMPPDSTELWQEGAQMRSFKLIEDDHFDEEGIIDVLLQPSQYPGCNGSRRLSDNISDLKAQVAANNKGATLIQALMSEYGQEVVQFYMRAIQSNAEMAVRGYLSGALKKLGPQLKAIDSMDNGSQIHLTIDLKDNGTATFDFTGTGCEMLSNLNAPPAITYSAIIYSLRLLIGTDIPMNQGCLAPITVVLPKGSFLNPSSGPAVCAGNTQTSQRVVDIVLKAFKAAAASQGCMNCLGFFGDGGVDAEGKKLAGSAYAFGETIAGGSGATKKQHGASGVAVHMTNTRITDPESLEKRYPVILREFSIREGSGGRGIHNGGDGCVRDIECRAPLKFSVITERRVIAPYGLE